MSADAEKTSRCDVVLVTRSVGRYGQAFMLRKVIINEREYLVPANAAVKIEAVPHGISTLTLTLFPTSVEFRPEEPT